MKTTSVIQLETADIFIDEEDFLWIKWKENCHFTIEMAHKHEEAIVKLCKDKKRLFIIDARVEYSMIEPEARRYMAKSEKVNACRIAQAMVSDKLGARLMVNFYIAFDRPPVPVKAFSNIEDAKKWLRTFLK